ncbi:hypothetical protein P8C59_000704 [Phyllachora maydis]|uniref:Uncharacterized protein n=1 Tax=Phyllachora maydis TaxID=1825666 RepID=A0AAD9HWY5_9PEZI|nr:hypothetical protein P8C59_000704 [Phyllachora maydis]
MADQAKGKGIAPKRASNPADPGQSSRPLLPIQTLLEDKEDGEDYSEVIEVLKQKEPYLGLAVNSATSNLDPPIDTGSKEGFKDTITSSIVKELSKKAYTIPDDKNPDISNTYSDSDQAVLLMLLRDSLSSGPRAAISWIHIPSKAFKLLIRQYSRPIESKKKDVYNEFHALTFSTYRKGLSAFNAEFNGYLAKLTMAKIVKRIPRFYRSDTSATLSNSRQSSRPPPPIRTLLEDKEDGEDYSKVIEVLKQHIKSHERDSVSAIKNISSTLASLTNSSNAAATGKTSYSPRFDPFSGTIDLDSPLRPPRKEPYLGPAIDNTATSNLDPSIDIGSKEGFKDTITSSIVKELSKKAYTIPDDRISNFLENPDISNTYSDSDQAVLLMLLRDSLSSSPRAAISWIYIPSKAFKLLVRQYSRPIESKKEDVYNKFHALTFSTYKKGLSAFNAEFNSYLTKLTMAKIDIDPSLILNQYFKALESKFPS